MSKIEKDKPKLGQEPAFPISEEILNLCGERPLPFGMSKRFYAACAAMQGLLASGKFAEGFAYNPAISELSYKLADELIRQENE